LFCKTCARQPEYKRDVSRQKAPQRIKTNTASRQDLLDFIRFTQNIAPVSKMPRKKFRCTVTQFTFVRKCLSVGHNGISNGLHIAGRPDDNLRSGRVWRGAGVLTTRDIRGLILVRVTESYATTRTENIKHFE